MTRILRMGEKKTLEHDEKGFFRIEDISRELGCSKNDVRWYVGYDKAHGKQRYEIR